MMYLVFTLVGFCSGSILYAYWIPKLVCNKDAYDDYEDGNPGTANAYLSGGLFVGTLCLLLELGKGFLPIYASLHLKKLPPCSMDSLLFVPVLVAPVLGHAAPFFHSKKGGKAIAVSFGVLLGLFPLYQPLAILAILYLMFSLVIVIRPHLFRSIITFFLGALWVFLSCPVQSVRIACILIAFVVIFKHLRKYDGEAFRIQLFLRHSSGHGNL